jgi:DNA-binding CsgD family transcriptional regulator
MDYTNAHIEAARWKDIYDFISICGKARSPQAFATKILENIGKLCSFDQALAYFFDGNGNACGQHLMGINESWSAMYLGHYANMDNKRYSCFINARKDFLGITQRCIDWDKEPSMDFVPNYIRPRNLKYSFGFGLFDLNDTLRMIISLDRVREKRFSNDEVVNLQLVIPQLNSLHKNFYYQAFHFNTRKQLAWDTESLTLRETEVADLLCQGVTPDNISRSLSIALSTTYKHISHIYKKLNVSSRQQLLVRLLHPYS